MSFSSKLCYTSQRVWIFPRIHKSWSLTWLSKECDSLWPDYRRTIEVSSETQSSWSLSGKPIFDSIGIIESLHSVRFYPCRNCRSPEYLEWNWVFAVESTVLEIDDYATMSRNLFHPSIRFPVKRHCVHVGWESTIGKHLIGNSVTHFSNSQIPDQDFASCSWTEHRPLQNCTLTIQKLFVNSVSN